MEKIGAKLQPMCGRATLTKRIRRHRRRARLPSTRRTTPRFIALATTSRRPTLHWIVVVRRQWPCAAAAVWGLPSLGRAAADQRARRAGRLGARVSRRVPGAPLSGRSPPAQWTHPQGADALDFADAPDNKLVLLAGLVPGACPATPARRTRPARSRRVVAQSLAPPRGATQPTRNPIVAPASYRHAGDCAASAIDEWLSAAPATAASLIRSAPDDALIATRGLEGVGSVKNDDPAVLAPPGPEADQARLSASLF